MNVLLERYPYRYVENGTLENGKPDFRIQKMDKYSPRWKDMYLCDNGMQLTQAIEDFHFNIAIANIRTLFNELSFYKNQTNKNKIIFKFCISNFLIILNPICPHICEEAWEILGNKESISNTPWPEVDLDYLNDNFIILPIQINGKRRAEIKVSKSLSSKQVESLA